MINLPLSSRDGAALTLRSLTLADLPAILAIEKRGHSHPCSEQVFSSFLQRASVLALGLVTDKRMVAFCIVSYVADESELINIVVDPDSHGQGLGRLLLQQAIDLLPKHINGMFLEVRESNTSAIALYDSMGFIETGMRKGYYPAEQGRENAILMALDLAGFEFHL